ncbi:MAG: acyl-CoA dehydrogenase family protein, partial [Mycobacteriales bacterium]
DGSATGAVALSAAGLTGHWDAGALHVAGRADVVLSGHLASVLVLGARTPDARTPDARTPDARTPEEAAEVWFVVPAAEVDAVAAGPGLDPARRVATVTATDLRIPESRTLPGATGEVVRDLAAVVLAAEAAGVAGWCLDAAVSYAGLREQFGRPIGSFQAIKHLCADLLVAVEEGRAAAWDAARAVSDPGERPIAAAVAAAVAAEGAVRAAKDAIQVLGGIGYTWEHDAHLYLKRASAIRQLLGSTSGWRRRAASLALAGAHRSLVLDLPPEAAELRVQTRAFIASLAGLDPPARRRALADAGYLAPHWPAPWGRGAGALEQLVIDEEFRLAGVRRPSLVIGEWAVPTLLTYGSPEQQERFVRPTLYGEISWCQMFSEPGAGSDLASLRTRAERVDGGWRISGQKVWTSLAHLADWAICLVRTDPLAPRHAGLSYLLVDMRSTGLTVRPLRDMTGTSGFTEVFLDDVFVPDACVVGSPGDGWRLARTTLANERVAMSSGASFGPGVDGILTALRRSGAEHDTGLLERVGALVCEAEALALLGFRTTLRQLSGTDPGPGSSVRKLVGMTHRQEAAELVLELAGPAALGAESVDAARAAGFVDASAAVMGFLSTRALTIAGGTSQVLRNVIAERLLGLPRDPTDPGLAT